MLNDSFQAHLWVHSIPASKCISEVTQYLSLQMHLQFRLTQASKCISEFTGFQSPSAFPNRLNYCLQVHLQGATAFVWRYRGNGDGLSEGEYIIDTPQSR
jgi:hypothetical protein